MDDDEVDEEENRGPSPRSGTLLPSTPPGAHAEDRKNLSVVATVFPSIPGPREKTPPPLSRA